MDGSRTLLAAIALAAFAAFPPAALGAALVPPGNSAANQYTETLPTTGGNAAAKKGKGITPGDVLGAGNARKLDSQGKIGREAAAVVAATAPPAVAPADGGAASGGGTGGNGGAGGGGQGGGTGPVNADDGSPSVPDRGNAVAAETSGSSGLGEVLGQATGSTASGGTGLLLPLVVLASAIWALVFFLRRRRRTA